MGGHRPVGLNVAKRVEEDQRIARNQEIVKESLKVLGTAEWHMKMDRYERDRERRKEEDQVKEELSQANEELKIRRRARLTALYEAEMAEYERQLNAMGLAIEGAHQ
uniref:Uncharacterized protein n=1 Tax=Palpitomonas bilix TaxID=652834 RepID=A0A7S3CY72_9EUKA|mmetsp:Transcript_14481/g.36903  ORF Transcript_14481/g.36903 Transcript_14481/m.36903 type:complete len:107 (+) Transcript_14481:306-626(+)|eukprot:CAMPEP_0113880930 /NCGR_PEP_ID=MMETSP0780_2-20120614/8076_1 /TAXON_ID=652834 /ORGANISM="Palpitomonas bilix" /LENGTH=106 /DNA_ID=CAMNT_0000867695 /DNA_START=275 /DNA_END=595 /DNA_ORIENTATION=- /assembly_acc=CAM_ASM_000599